MPKADLQQVINSVWTEFSNDRRDFKKYEEDAKARGNKTLEEYWKGRAESCAKVMICIMPYVDMRKTERKQGT